MKVGIEKLNLYTPRLCTDAVALAERRGKDRDVVISQIMVDSRAVIPPFEDAVTLAVNAVKRLLAPADIEQIELLVVGTESAVDFGKPISTWVHRFCGLSPNCRNFEVKHACYGATAALKMAALWVASGVRPGKKALVVSTDYTRPGVAGGFDFVGGACAVAMLVSADPQILEIDPGQAGYWTTEIADTFRPTGRAEMGDNQTSLYAYLDALEGAYSHFRAVVGEIDYEAMFQKHIYHAPFPGMTVQAHRTLLGWDGPVDKATAAASFQRKVNQGLTIARRIGSAYGASNFVCLLGLITTAEDCRPGDCLSLFAYGSGCQGEFYSGILGPAAGDAGRALDIARHLDERLPLSLDDYEQNELAREATIDQADVEPLAHDTAGLYPAVYAGQNLLVLKQIHNYYREYGWS
ncbi:MAG: 3-hydroxy-3-methylglutaryl-ACP synthase [Chloroflexi bacterium]|nr:3-hydroxy-3-methylglutaryl-ACP synthase [Chloroflexota bacterium]MCI0581194.1 3-hydroxy-3-methylglutaryl-ACP synthase [Chloroflexota bacterium]MCI0644118.1 3-hydroxy-3-methylglutaryl-ACP synthase [Chloroflexota bacterium]MCI0731739.1 3-hydroxy-3-methylglutaryl-ACP synthase [Chloroflexota bacterium]